jgi:hypothetical protein
MDITTQQQQEYGSAGQQPIPCRLERAVEEIVLLGQPGQLVDDDDGRRAG